jgi:hypothetical protein
MKYVKETTKVDPITNEPKIDKTLLAAILEMCKNKKKDRPKLLDKEFEMRSPKKRKMS